MLNEATLDSACFIRSFYDGKQKYEVWDINGVREIYRVEQDGSLTVVEVVDE